MGNKLARKSAAFFETEKAKEAQAKFDMEVAMQFPPWCFKDVKIDDHIRGTVDRTWKMVLSGNNHSFREAQAVRPSLTPLAFFYNVFYDSFFSLVPESLPLYIRGIQSQGRMLAHVLHFLVTNLDNGDEFDSTLKYLAVMHNQRAVNPCHYGTMGLCLIFSIRRVLGDENFDSDARYCWTCLYSRLMQVMIPIAVSKQMEHSKEVLAHMYRYNMNHTDNSSVASSEYDGPDSPRLPDVSSNATTNQAPGYSPTTTQRTNHETVTRPDSPSQSRVQPAFSPAVAPDTASEIANARVASALLAKKANEAPTPSIILHPDVAKMTEQIAVTFSNQTPEAQAEHFPSLRTAASATQASSPTQPATRYTFNNAAAASAVVGSGTITVDSKQLTSAELEGIAEQFTSSMQQIGREKQQNTA